MVEIKWTRNALNWLKEIYDFIATDNPKVALQIVQNIYKKVDKLHEFPNLGYRLLNYRDHHIRILQYGHYRVAYLIKSSDAIDVLGVFHGSLDINRYLKP